MHEYLLPSVVEERIKPSEWKPGDVVQRAPGSVRWYLLCKGAHSQRWHAVAERGKVETNVTRVLKSENYVNFGPHMLEHDDEGNLLFTPKGFPPLPTPTLGDLKLLDIVMDEGGDIYVIADMFGNTVRVVNESKKILDFDASTRFIHVGTIEWPKEAKVIG